MALKTPKRHQINVITPSSWSFALSKHIPRKREFGQFEKISAKKFDFLKRPQPTVLAQIDQIKRTRRSKRPESASKGLHLPKTGPKSSKSRSSDAIIPVKPLHRIASSMSSSPRRISSQKPLSTHFWFLKPTKSGSNGLENPENVINQRLNTIFMVICPFKAHPSKT